MMQDMFSFGRALYHPSGGGGVRPCSHWGLQQAIDLDLRSLQAITCSFLRVLGRRCIMLPAEAQGGTSSK